MIIKATKSRKQGDATGSIALPLEYEWFMTKSGNLNRKYLVHNGKVAEIVNTKEEYNEVRSSRRWSYYNITYTLDFNSKGAIRMSKRSK